MNFLFLTLGLFFSLASLSQPEDGQHAHSDSGKSWTMLVYMVADNNLEQAGLDDLQEMADVGSGDNFNLVVQIDRAVGYTGFGLSDNESDWTGARRLYIHPGGYEILQDMGEPNMGDVNALTDFITWGVQNFPADRYGLIFWDHGASWPGFGGDESTSNMDMLDLNELRTGIENGIQATEIKEFALLGFDACLMSTVEVALTLGPYGEYLLASEELEPGHGWDYRALSQVRSDPTRNPVDIGKDIIQGFVQQAGEQGTQAGVTLSLIDLYTMDSLHDALAAFAQKLSEIIQNQANLISLACQQAVHFADMPDPQRSFNMVDIGDFTRQLSGSSSSLGDSDDELFVALDQAVVSMTAGSSRRSATGLSIYFPLSQNFYQTSYEQVPNIEEWRIFLHTFYNSTGSGQVPQFTNPDKIADFLQDNQGVLTISGGLRSGSSQSIVDALLYTGLYYDNNDVLFLGDRPASYSDTVVQGQWDLSALTLTEGSHTSYLYSSFSAVDGNQFLLILPFWFEANNQDPGQYSEMRLLLDSQGSIVQNVLYGYSDSGPGELSPQAGSALYPLSFQLSNTGLEMVSLDDVPFNPLGALQLGTEFVGSGKTVFCGLSIMNSQNQGDEVSILLDI